MGAALVGVFAIVVSSTAWVFHSPHEAVSSIVEVIVAAVLVDGLLVLLPWRRLPIQLLMVFPLLLLGSMIALAATTNGIAANYTGFFTLAFIYIGITQPRWTSSAFAVLVTPSWLYCQQGQTAHVEIRLPIAMAIWLLIGEVLAARAVKSRARTGDLIARASTDILTGLASRLLMSDRIDRSLSDHQDRRSALLLVDLDGFKAINDAFGHAVGDELLVVVADRIRTVTGHEDLVARLGGDEFAVYAHRCTLPDAVKIGERLIRATAEPIELTRGRVGVTASVGIVDLAGCGSAQDAIRDADVAMYEAKSAGKSRVSVFEADMQERVAARLQLETELRIALDEDQFEVHYQPTVHAETRQIVGFEALMRWRHPQRGMLAADDFIGACEDIGLIVPLGNWILKMACRQARLWQPVDPGLRLTMAVNLSARQLFDTDLVAEVKEALAQGDLRGDALVLEITERLLLVDSPFVLQQLAELKELGIRIAIDDFGTGYSSLAYLRDFPIDILKIDRSFVEPLDDDRQAVALVRSIIGIADALDLDVIAEGAETLAQVEVLSQIGCYVIQGYYFGRPSSADDVGTYLSADRGMPRVSPGDLTVTRSNATRNGSEG
jgi:diguanylate cyclase (GGDEF)-like protein